MNVKCKFYFGIDPNLFQVVQLEKFALFYVPYSIRLQCLFIIYQITRLNNHRNNKRENNSVLLDLSIISII